MQDRRKSAVRLGCIHREVDGGVREGQDSDARRYEAPS